MGNRVGLFVDGNNVFYSQKGEGAWDIDAKRVVDWLTEKEGPIVTAHWYVGLPNEAERDTTGKFRSFLSMLGFRVIAKITKNYGGGKGQKANADVELACDALVSVDKWDTFVLFSGDNDFTYLVELLLARGKRVVVVSSRVIGHELRNSADEYIDYNDVRDKIEKVYEKLEINPNVVMPITKAREEG